MRTRCHDKNHPSYNNYGGRGIKVCEEWDDYMKFRDWSYNNGYDENAEYKKCTLDRINNNGNYEPKNCRFVDARIQSINRRSTKKYNYNGEFLSLPEIADKSGLSRDLLYDRIVRRKWSVERATETEVNKSIDVNSEKFRNAYNQFKRKEKSARKIYREMGICFQTFKSLIQKYEEQHGNLDIKY